MTQNQLANVGAKVHDLQGAREELQAVLSRLANEKAEIARLQELIPKYKPIKRLTSYDEVSDLAFSGSRDSGNNCRRPH